MTLPQGSPQMSLSVFPAHDSVMAPAVEPESFLRLPVETISASQNRRGERDQPHPSAWSLTLLVVQHFGAFPDGTSCVTNLWLSQ